jgi:hypothetical protein
LLRIHEHRWQELEWFEDLTQDQTYVLVLAPQVWMVWRVIKTYPNWFEVLYLGDPDDSTYHG